MDVAAVRPMPARITRSGLAEVDDIALGMSVYPCRMISIAYRQHLPRQRKRDDRWARHQHSNAGKLAGGEPRSPMASYRE